MAKAANLRCRMAITYRTKSIFGNLSIYTYIWCL